jgi:hypothetical protein
MIRFLNRNDEKWPHTRQIKIASRNHILPPLGIDDSPYYVFVALCIVVIVVSLIKIAASNENIECFREYFAVGYRAPDSIAFSKSSCTGQDKR